MNEHIATFNPFVCTLCNDNRYRNGVVLPTEFYCSWLWVTIGSETYFGIGRGFRGASSYVGDCSGCRQVYVSHKLTLLAFLYRLDLKRSRYD